MTDKRKVLNVGGNNKNIAIPRHYADFEHLLLDIDPRGKPDIICDARELTKLDGGQFDAIYCSHNLEHFFPHDVPKVLAGFLHVLKPDGFAEIRVPDLDLVMKTYVEKQLDIEDVLYQSGAGPIMVRDVLYGFGKEIQRSGVDFYAHKTGFTPKSLRKALFSAGFKYAARGQGRAYELFIIAFPKQPTEFHQKLLGFTMPKPAAA
jgi:SAM-dependent methyltransferase